MVNNSSKSTTDSGVTFGNGFTGGTTTIASDNPQLQITTIKLNGSNYVRWSQSVRMYIYSGGSKIGYITGTAKKPEEEDAKFEIWNAEKSRLMTWLVNSMTVEIGANYLGYDTTHEL
ncbi:hypothetical protein LINGRAHAP2_LOCUS23692 [Linum grandiflorum]